MAASEHIAHTLLLKAHKPDTASAIFTEKVLHKPLHLRGTSPNPNSHDSRTQRRLQRLRKKERSRRRLRPKPLSAKEKRISGIYDISKDAQKHEIYVPLHQMWMEYMWEILGMTKSVGAFVTAQSAGSKLASADYHGADMMVVRSKCTGLVGLAGIVVRDTKFTFQIITKKNELKSMCSFAHSYRNDVSSMNNLELAIPKKHTVFRFELVQPTEKDTIVPCQTNQSEISIERKVQNFVFELHGSQFENRATDRATKKFKQRNLTDL